MYSNVTRVTGLSSGIDTDGMIRQLMNAESLKMNKLKQNRQLIEWKQQSYRSVASTLSKFQSSFTSLTGAGMSTSLRLASNFQTLKSTVQLSDGSASTAIKARATSASATGSISLEVVNAAQKDTYTGETIDMKYTAQNSIVLGSYMEGKLQSGDSFTVSLDGATAVSITLTGADVTGTDAEIAKKLNDKLRDRFQYTVGSDGKPTNQQKVSVKTVTNPETGAISLSFVAGAGHTVTVDNGPDGNNALAKLGFTEGGTTKFDTKTTLAELGAFAGMSEDKKTLTFTINDVNFYFDRTDSLEKVMNDVNKSKAGVTLTFDSFRSTFKMESNTTGSSGAISFTDTDGFFANTLGMKDSYQGTKAQAANFKLTDRLESTAYYQGLSVKPEQLKFSINGVDFSFNKGAQIDSILETVNNSKAGVKMSYDERSRTFSLATGEGAKNNRIVIDDTDGFLNGFMGIDADKPTTSARSTAAADALFKYNGVYLSRESNIFELEGIEITLTEAAAGKTFDINQTRDVQPAMDLIKKFVEEYNNLIDTLYKQTSTSRPKSGDYSFYDPLSDDQRAAMSDKEVEQWEEQAKTGMLYRDEMLNTFQSQLRNMMYTSVTREDGSKIALYDIGITTSSADRYIGKLQIDESVLREALEKNSEAVSDLFTKSSSMPGTTVAGRKARLTDEGIGDRLNDLIRNAIDVGGSIYTKAGLEGTGSIKNNDLQKELEKQDAKISDMLKYLVRRENSYYSMFSRMETAMSKANSQMESLYSLLGS